MATERGSLQREIHLPRISRCQVSWRKGNNNQQRATHSQQTAHTTQHTFFLKWAWNYPPPTNMATERGSLQREIHLPRISRCQVSGGRVTTISKEQLTSNKQHTHTTQHTFVLEMGSELPSLPRTWQQRGVPSKGNSSSKDLQVPG